MIQLLRDIKRCHGNKSDMIVCLLDNLQFRSCIDRCTEDAKITTALHFVNMVHDPTTMNAVMHSVSEREASILQDMIVAVHTGLP